MRWRILTIVATLYTAQFIPLFFAIIALPVILRMEGHSATVIGLVQMAGLPYVFKFLWAPLIDRYKPGRDRYRSWIVVLSFVHVISIGFLAMADPRGDLVFLFAALFVAALAVSTQDVAVDALVISMLRPSERSMGATFQNFGAYSGAVIGGFGFLYIYDNTGWTVALVIQAVIFAAPLFVLVLIKEPVRLRGLPPVTFGTALRFFTQPRIGPWFAILATMRVPLMMTMLPMRLMMVDQGMSAEEIAVWFGLFAMSAGGGATALFGPLLRNIPRVQSLYIVGLLNIPVLIGVAYVAAEFPDLIRYAIVIAWAAIAMTDIAIYRGAMDKVRPEIPGFDFSAQIAIYSLVGLFADPVIGYVIDTQGNLPAFLFAIPAALVPLAVLYFTVAKPWQAAQGLDGERARSTGTMTTLRGQECLAFCAEEFEAHGITCTWPQPDILKMEEMGCLVEMKALDGALDILIETPSDNFLVFIREEIIEHLEEFDGAATETLRWTGGIKPGEMPSNFRILRATRRSMIASNLARVTLEGIDVQAMTRDGIHVRLMMPLERGRTPVWPVITENGGTHWPDGEDTLHSRYVTIREIRLDAREIDVDIAVHQGGLISDWALLDGDDQEVGVMGPMGDAGLEHTQNVILAGDATGLPAIARLIESVGGRATGFVFAASQDHETLEAYLPKSSLTLVPMDPATFSAEIAEKVRSCTNDPVSYGWFAGEFSAAQAMRKVFKQTFGLDKRSQLSVAYWKDGDPGHQSRAV